MKLRVVTALAASAALALSAAAPAHAGWGMDPSPEAWAKWTERANGILDAARNGRQVGAACEGVRGDFIRAPFPMWAQGMISLCDAIRGAQGGRFMCTAVDKDYNCTAEVKGITGMERKHICQEANAAIGMLKGAKPTDKAPGAAELALSLASLGRGVKQFYHCL